MWVINEGASNLLMMLVLDIILVKKERVTSLLLLY